MTEDERHVRVMASIARRKRQIFEEGEINWFGPRFFREMTNMDDAEKIEMARHQERRRQIISANPAPGFKYRLC